MSHRFQHPPILVVVLTLFLPAWSSADELIVKSVKPANAGNRPFEGFGLKRADVARIKNSLPKLNSVVVTRVMSQTVRRGASVLNVRLIGTDAALQKIDELPIKQGRFVTEQDVKKRNSVAVLSARAAATLFPGQDPVGDEIRVGKQYFVVVGVTKAGGAKRALDLDVFIPITTMRVRFGDSVVRRETGSFVAERYELSEARFVFSGRDAAASKAIVEQVLRLSHATKDYSIRLETMPRDR